MIPVTYLRYFTITFLSISLPRHNMYRRNFQLPISQRNFTLSITWTQSFNYQLSLQIFTGSISSITEIQSFRERLNARIIIHIHIVQNKCIMVSRCMEKSSPSAVFWLAAIFRSGRSMLPPLCIRCDHVLT